MPFPDAWFVPLTAKNETPPIGDRGCLSIANSWDGLGPSLPTGCPRAFFALLEAGESVLTFRLQIALETPLDTSGVYRSKRFP